MPLKPPMAAKPEEKPDGAPEWMVSFADMITIMMSFFVIMFAIASGEAAKGRQSRRQKVAIESLNNRFGPKFQPFASWGLAPGTMPVKQGGSQPAARSVVIRHRRRPTSRQRENREQRTLADSHSRLWRPRRHRRHWSFSTTRATA